MHYGYLAGALAVWILSAFSILSTLWLSHKGKIKPGTASFIGPVFFHAGTALLVLFLLLKALGRIP